MKLSSLSVGKNAKVVSIAYYNNHYKRLNDFGFRVDAPVSVVKKYGNYYIINLFQGYAVIDKKTADNITVEPL